jgi:hypothetical protein
MSDATDLAAAQTAAQKAADALAADQVKLGADQEKLRTAAGAVADDNTVLTADQAALAAVAAIANNLDADTAKAVAAGNADAAAHDKVTNDTTTDNKAAADLAAVHTTQDPLLKADDAAITTDMKAVTDAQAVLQAATAAGGSNPTPTQLVSIAAAKAALDAANKTLATDQATRATDQVPIDKAQAAKVATAAAIKIDTAAATAADAALAAANVTVRGDAEAKSRLSIPAARIDADKIKVATDTVSLAQAQAAVIGDQASVAADTSLLNTTNATVSFIQAKIAAAAASEADADKAAQAAAAAQAALDAAKSAQTAAIAQAAASEAQARQAIAVAQAALEAAKAAPPTVINITNITNIVLGQPTAGSIAFINTLLDAQAARLYTAAFGRAPDDAGLAYWTKALQSGTPLVDIARGFCASDEFKSHYGSSDHQALVTGFYENVLGRAPDAAGTAYWTDALDRGTATQAQVLCGFSECIENKAHTPDADTASVARLYYATLGRGPDAAGLSFWTGKLADGGATLTDEATALAKSPEFIGHYGNLGDSDFVGQLYQNVLGRAADDAGRATWTNALAAGANRGSVVTSFSESAEFKDKFSTTIAQHGIPLT